MMDKRTGHRIDDDHLTHVFEMVQRIEAAVAAIDYLRRSGGKQPAQGQGDSRAKAVIPVQGVAKAEDAQTRLLRHESVFYRGGR